MPQKSNNKIAQVPSKLYLEKKEEASGYWGIIHLAIDFPKSISVSVCVYAYAQSLCADMQDAVYGGGCDYECYCRGWFIGSRWLEVRD